MNIFLNGSLKRLRLKSGPDQPSPLPRPSQLQASINHKPNPIPSHTNPNHHPNPGQILGSQAG